MHEVFRDWDTATVGLVNHLLKEAGIRTILRNWEGCNITEIPIPAIYPNICVIDEAEVDRAKELIFAFRNSSQKTGKDWNCSSCAESVGYELNECWNCGKASDFQAH